VESAELIVVPVVNEPLSAALAVEALVAVVADEAAAPAPKPPVANAKPPIAKIGNILRGAHINFYSQLLKFFLFLQNNVQ
jgi:hypothetical protein